MSSIKLTDVATIGQLPPDTFAKILQFGNPEAYTEGQITGEIFETYLQNVVSSAKKKDKPQAEFNLYDFLFTKSFAEEFHYLIEQIADEEQESIALGVIPYTVYDHLVKKLKHSSPERIANTLVSFVKEFCILYEDIQTVVIEGVTTPQAPEEVPQDTTAPTEQEEKQPTQEDLQGTEVVPVATELQRIAGMLEKLQQVNNQQINSNQVNVNVNVNPNQSQQEKARLTAAERIEKAKQFAKLIDTFTKIEAKYQAFNEFLAGYNGEETGSLQFKNGSEKIEIFNAKTMMKVLVMVHDDLTAIVQEYKAKVETFVM